MGKRVAGAGDLTAQGRVGQGGREGGQGGIVRTEIGKKETTACIISKNNAKKKVEETQKYLCSSCKHRVSNDVLVKKTCERLLECKERVLCEWQCGSL